MKVYKVMRAHHFVNAGASQNESARASVKLQLVCITSLKGACVRVSNLAWDFRGPMGSFCVIPEGFYFD